MRLTERVHQLLHQHIANGDLAIDATAGNGHDTVTLATQVGHSGHVYAIDLQEKAIASTQARLQSSDLLDRCTLIHQDHSTALELLAKKLPEKIATIVFNLGYLPGSDKALQTNTKTTRQALDASTLLLKQGGQLYVTAYRGHNGGTEEAHSVAIWMKHRRTQGWHVECHEPTQPTAKTPPILWVAHKTDA